MKPVVVTNMNSFDATNANFIKYSTLNYTRGVKLFFHAASQTKNCDVVFINCDSVLTYMMSLVLIIQPFNKCKLIIADLILNQPIGFLGRIVSWFKRRLLQRVDLFLLFQKDISGYQKYYGIESEKVRYVPFKVNSLDIISSLIIEEGDYIFASGLSNRDWATLAKAMQGLTIPLVISIPDDNFIRINNINTILPNPKDFGSNTKFVRNDADPRNWLKLAARSKFAVLPVYAGSLNPSGVSTYLQIMALKKCCIVSEGPSTTDILSEETSYVVPPNDANALRDAILLVDSDDNLRHLLALGGYKYAMSLGGTSRLHFDFIKEILECFNGETVMK